MKNIFMDTIPCIYSCVYSSRHNNAIIDNVKDHTHIVIGLFQLFH